MVNSRTKRLVASCCERRLGVSFSESQFEELLQQRLVRLNGFLRRCPVWPLLRDRGLRFGWLDHVRTRIWRGLCGCSSKPTPSALESYCSRSIRLDGRLHSSYICTHDFFYSPTFRIHVKRRHSPNCTVPSNVFGPVHVHFCKQSHVCILSRKLLNLRGHRTAWAAPGGKKVHDNNPRPSPRQESVKLSHRTNINNPHLARSHTLPFTQTRFCQANPQKHQNENKNLSPLEKKNRKHERGRLVQTHCPIFQCDH
mmetsp:Transcript_20433/g.29646  ORF Transcript_20433/g.29646 Transcript_20433/m.29646 type:complete len:254 (-) Transcript_20433:37-798(-)